MAIKINPRWQIITLVRDCIKHIFLGKSKSKSIKYKYGLLKGLKFNIDDKTKFNVMCGCYETEIKKWCENFTSKAQWAIDVGSDSGYYALYFAAQENIKQIFAFEPNIISIEKLKKNAELNGPCLLKKIVIFNKFVSERNNGKEYNLDVNLYGLKAEPLIIKIDVDGGEGKVLKSLNRTLKENKCMLIIETHSQELERECNNYLKDRGYQTKIIKNAWWRMFFPEDRPIEHNRWLVAY